MRRNIPSTNTAAESFFTGVWAARPVKRSSRRPPRLQAKADELGNKADDYLVESRGAFAQKTVGMMLLETGKGSFDVGAGLSEGDWLVLHDSEGRVLVYSIKGGELRHRFFGGNAAINPTKNQLVGRKFSRRSCALRSRHGRAPDQFRDQRRARPSSASISKATNCSSSATLNPPTPLI